MRMKRQGLKKRIKLPITEVMNEIIKFIDNKGSKADDL